MFSPPGPPTVGNDEYWSPATISGEDPVFRSLRQVSLQLETLVSRIDQLSISQCKVEASVAALLSENILGASAFHSEQSVGGRRKRACSDNSVGIEQLPNRNVSGLSNLTRNSPKGRRGRRQETRRMAKLPSQELVSKLGQAAVGDGSDSRTPDELFSRLLHLINVDEEEVKRRISMETMDDTPGLVSSVRSLRMTASQTPEKISAIIDAGMAIVICINALIVGFSCDVVETWIGWVVLDMIFVAVFAGELVCKLLLFGFRSYFLKPNGGGIKFLECFDSAIVVLDISFVILLTADSLDVEMPSPSVFRLVRLARLGRLVRIYRVSFIQELLVMVDGMVSGMETLGWSLLLVLFPIYAVALFLRETLGRSDVSTLSMMFKSVPRSIFTMLRCSFGDCSTEFGTPVFEHVHDEWGWPFSIFFSLFIFMITIGLFNVICAIFVDNVLTASTSHQLAQKHTRLSDETLLASRLVSLMRVMMAEMGLDIADKALTDMVDTLKSFEITSDVFDQVLSNPVVIDCLDDLDICQEDHGDLFDILDSDNGGTMLFGELLAGIEKLRGEPRRSDIVCVDLMVRAVQQDVNTIMRKLCGNESGPNIRVSTF